MNRKGKQGGIRLVRTAVKVGLSIALCLYLFVLSKLLLFKYFTIQQIMNHLTFNFESYPWLGNHNFIPFKTIAYYLFLANDINFIIRLENLLGNIIAFIPFGFFLPLLSKKFHSFKMVALATFCLSLTFELIQLIFRFGSFDVDDLILNTVGGMIGYIPVKVVSRYVRRRRKEQKRTLG